MVFTFKFIYIVQLIFIYCTVKVSTPRLSPIAEGKQTWFGKIMFVTLRCIQRIDIRIEQWVDTFQNHICLHSAIGASPGIRTLTVHVLFQIKFIVNSSKLSHFFTIYTHVYTIMNNLIDSSTIIVCCNQKKIKVNISNVIKSSTFSPSMHVYTILFTIVNS